MSRGNARQRTSVMVRETNRARSKAVKVWGIEISTAVCAKFVAIQTVEKKDNNVLW
jgi:hypothetical protein